MSGPEEGAVVDDTRAAAMPSTGDPTIDDALQDLHDLPLTPLAEQHDRLARAHEALHVALERSGDQPDAT